jgi:hypothetical protein
VSVSAGSAFPLRSWNDAGALARDVEIAPRRALSRQVWYVVMASRNLTMAGSPQSAQTLDAANVALTVFLQRRDDPIEAVVNPLMKGL